MHGNITGLVSAEEPSAELPSQLIGIELCSAPVSSAYTREQRPALHPAATDHPLPLPRGSSGRVPHPRPVSRWLLSFSLSLSRSLALPFSLSLLPFRTQYHTLQPPHEKPSTARCTAVVSTTAATAAGTTTLLVDASRTCRRPCALLSGRASKSEQTRPHCEIARTPGRQRRRAAGKKRDVIAFPLLPLRGRVVICYHLV